MDFLNYQYLGNSVGGYLWFLAWVGGAFILKGLTAKIIINILAKTTRSRQYNISTQEFQDILKKGVSTFIFIAVLYVSVQFIDFPDSWNLASREEFGLRWFIYILYGIAFGISLTYVFMRFADCFALILTRKYETRNDSPSMIQVISFATDLSKVIILILGILVILGTLFHVNVAALIAGLGIGGLAIALAAKETLENLLGSFIIYFDKPFKIGDSIELNGARYTVEKVGLRSSRLRTLHQTEMTIPNKILVESKIDNYSMIKSRRIDRTIKLSRDTRHSQLTNIIAEIKEEISGRILTIDNPEVNFHQIGESSLDLRIKYNINAEWEEHLTEVESINLRILEIIEKNNARLAFPTRLIYLHRDEKE